ncbi:aldehyde dehydrogenase family 3 member F1 isoform X1 [Cryptomeria japonica]|uniref:aldehyde dehydrogenase family 3 member F1 isoform X1 n=1 Tax=Cryptomeria japonica TaxID=3369 RepID=UPI0027DA854B|nr:aldehyde dehydrogenase family 3 member F1 isoform X1 [Cryptomeria japonica]
MDLRKISEEMKSSFNGGKTLCMNWRRNQLEAILKLVVENEEEILDALHTDLGKSQTEAYRDEVALVINAARFALKNLHKWMAPIGVSLPLIAFYGSASLIAEPLGVVLIFTTWNFPFNLALEPLVGAIAAGNAVVLKPSEMAAATSDLLAYLIPKYLDNSMIRVVQGGPEECAKLLELKWDKIFFTGSARIGRIVMTAAAKHLTPVTLELGGKCPTIVDRMHSNDDLLVTAKRIVFGKWMLCNGQACVSPDYILVQEEIAAALVDSLKKTIKKFYGEDPSKSSDLSRIVNKNHFLRLTKYLQDPSIANTIVYGGRHDEKRLYMQPTILLNPPLTSDIMNEEIFGPLLPVITMKRIEDSIEFINSRPKPLAIYLFTNRENLRKRLLNETSSGSLVFNDTGVQFALDGLPFGGVGESGLGKYHGKYSFDTFSHQKAVLYRSLFPEIFFRYPPWNAFKLNMLKTSLAFDYWGAVLVFLGLKKMCSEVNREQKME